MSENDIVLKNLTKRVDKLEHIFDVVNSLTIEIKQLAMETKYMRLEQNKLSERVDVLEHKPEKRWDTIITAILTTLTGGIIGAVITLITK